MVLLFDQKELMHSTSNSYAHMYIHTQEAGRYSTRLNPRESAAMKRFYSCLESSDRTAAWKLASYDLSNDSELNLYRTSAIGANAM